MRRIALFAAALSVAILSAPCTRAAEPVTREEALARWLKATGGRARVAAVKTVSREAKETSGGEEGTLKTWSTSAGRFRDDDSIAGFDSTELFDGLDGWTVPVDAPPHKVGPADRENRITESYFAAFAQWFPERRGGVITLESASEEEVVLAIRPDGGREARVTLDRRTWLPLRMQQRSAERIETAKFVSWESAGGVQFPKEILDQLGNPKYDTRLVYTKTVVNAALAPSLLAVPKRAATVEYRSASHETIVPIELTQNHIYFPVSVNGHPPLWFIFDTGADFTAVEVTRAKELALAAKGAFEARGSGEASVDVGVISNPHIAFGDVEIPLHSAATLPLAALSQREGRSIDGIAGYNVISRFIVEIDYAGHRLRFFDPSIWKAPHDAVELPFVFHGNTPIARIPITARDGRTVPARLEIDTGSRSGVDLSRRFLEENHISAPPSAVNGPLGAGVGGATQQLVGRLAAIDLAGVPLSDPVTSFSTATSGAETSPDLDGILGGEVLRRFTVTIDYPHQRLLLRKNEHFDEPFEYDMSGLLLTGIGHVTVKNVLAGSPAADAALAVNDELLAIDGNQVNGMTLEEVRALLRIDGKIYTLKIKRGNEERDVRLTTRRLV